MGTIVFGSRRNGAGWQEWNDELAAAANQFLNSTQPWPWEHDFKEEPSPGDAEASYISRLVFMRFIENSPGRPEVVDAVLFDPDKVWLTISIGKRGYPLYFDIMNNPRCCGDYNRLAYIWHKEEPAPFYSMYQHIGNFAMLPEWLRRNKEISLNVEHRYKGERWDAFLKYYLLGAFQANGDSPLSFKDYVKLNCMYQYIYGCPQPDEGWKTADCKWWKAQIKQWDEWLDDREGSIEIASVIDAEKMERPYWNKKNVEEYKNEADVLSEILRTEDEHERKARQEKASARIKELIEVRGRCITSIAKGE